MNTLFKDNWGRARPYQVIPFSHHPFIFLATSFGSSKDNSFPSGHVSIGAFIGVPFIAARRRKLGVVALCGIGFVVVGIVRFCRAGIISEVIFLWRQSWFGSLIFLVTKLVDKYFMNKRVD